jgi:hypothetical protein
MSRQTTASVQLLWAVHTDRLHSTAVYVLLRLATRLSTHTNWNVTRVGHKSWAKHGVYTSHLLLYKLQALKFGTGIICFLVFSGVWASRPVSVWCFSSVQVCMGAHTHTGLHDSMGRHRALIWFFILTYVLEFAGSGSALMLVGTSVHMW